MVFRVEWAKDVPKTGALGHGGLVLSGGCQSNYCKGHIDTAEKACRVVTEALHPLAQRPHTMEPSTTSPAISVAITVLVALLALTGFGVYTAFGPPSKGLTDPFDDHDD